MSAIQQAIIASTAGGPPKTVIWNGIWYEPVSEGQQQHIQIIVNNWDNSPLYWRVIGYGNVNLSGQMDTDRSVIWPGTGTSVQDIYFTFLPDLTTEGNSLYYMYFGSSEGANDYFIAGPYTVNDTSTNPLITIGAQYDPVNEGQANNFTVTNTNNNIPNTQLFWTASWTGTNMNSGRFNGAGSGSFTLDSSSQPTASFDVTVSSDFATSPDTQQYTITIWAGYPGGRSLGVIGPITVTDTSQTVNSFSLTAPPADGRYLPWTDGATGVTASITNTAGNWGTTASYGGGIVWDNANYGYVTLNYTDNDAANFTLSFAADFQPEAGHWNSIFGSYFGGPFAYAYGDTISAGVGSNTPVQVTSGVTGLAWWDFVYMGTTLTIYKNGNQVATGTIPSTVLGSNIQIGSRPGTTGDYLVGTIYQIKYQRTALLQLAITNQYDAVKSTYGLS
jgi:hypothetical protein